MAECLKAGGGRHRPSEARKMASPPGFVPARVERERDAACLKAGGGRHRPSIAREMASPPARGGHGKPTDDRHPRVREGGLMAA